MRVLGIDPSLTSTGLVLVEGGQVVETKRVRSKLTGYARVQRILREIEQMVFGPMGRAHDIGYEPTGSACADEMAPVNLRVGIEGTAMGARGSSVVQIFGLWGVITQQLWEWGAEPYVVAPSARIKYATGKGNSSKDEVLAAVVRRYTNAEVTGNDVADALIIAAMGARKYGEPLEADLPKANLEAMEKVQWPA